VAKAAYFPTLTLSADFGFASNALSNLFTLPNRFWAFGASLAQTVLLSNQRTALTLRMEQMTATVQLIEALGGGWDASRLASR
jgi:outer membrane protein TolC